MKKTLMLVSFVALLSALSFAQVAMIPTTLSVAVTSSSQTTVQLAAVTGLNSNSYALAAGTSYLYVDGEFMSVTAVNAKTVSVVRGYSGTRAATHASGAYVFAGPANFFSASRPGLLPAGSCTRSNIPALPRPDVNSQQILDCVGGVWTVGQYANMPGVSEPLPQTGAVSLTGVGTGSAGTAVTPSTTYFCSEIDVPFSRLLTGMAVLNGGTAATDTWIYLLYDASGNLLANTATAGTTASGTNVYQQIAFTSKYWITGPAKYYACLNGSATGSSTATMLKTGMQDTFAAGGVTGQTFGTASATITVPTTFTTAKGPYWELY